jgi:hypothetical protein
MALKKFANYVGGNNGGTDGCVWTPAGELVLPALDHPRANAKALAQWGDQARTYHRASVAVAEAVAKAWLDQWVWPQLPERIAETYSGSLVDSIAPMYGATRNGQPLKAPPRFDWLGWEDGNRKPSEDKPPYNPGQMVIRGAKLSLTLGEVKDRVVPFPGLYVIDGDQFAKFSGSPAEIAAKFYPGAEVRLLVQPTVYNNTGLGLKFDLVAVCWVGEGHRRNGASPAVNMDAAGAAFGVPVATGPASISPDDM